MEHQIIRIPYKYSELINTMEDCECWKLMKALFTKDNSELDWLSLTYYNIIIVDINNLENMVKKGQEWGKKWWRPKKEKTPGVIKEKTPPLWNEKPKISKDKINKDNIKENSIKEKNATKVATLDLKKIISDSIIIEDFVKQYNSDEEYIKKQVMDFYMYWSEKKPWWKKERWEMQKTFDVSRRLHKRVANSAEWSKNASTKNKGIII